MRFMADVVLWLAITGGAAFFEHPQWASWLAESQPPSVWITPWMRQLRRLKCCSVVSFDQCIFGVDIKKPTTLLLVRLRSVREAILKLGRCGRCAHAGGHVALKGREEDGTFRTARGKVYPPRMNDLLGRAVIDFIVTSVDSDFVGAELPSCFDPFFADCFADDMVVQPDYHG